MKRIIKILCLGLSITNPAQAVEDEQKFTVANNGTVIAVASQKEITRIVFSSDVESVHSIAGELEYNVQGKDVYLRTSVEKPVNFFVRTVQGQTYKFIMDVRDIPATQIFVESNTLKKNQIIDYRKPVYKNDKISEGLQQRIAKIIDVTLKPKKHLGFTINKTNKNSGSINGISLQQMGIITGKMLIAKKFIITNESDDQQSLNLRDFIEEGILAVYADKDRLNSGEKGILIKISEE